ncbi:MAG: NAD(P)/FAD-dependent oxidoreductase [Cyanobium sp.]
MPGAPLPGGVLETTVLVVGAGPAGADLARQLARAGIAVLLVDQLPDLRQAAFSSAALPLECLDRFALPAQVVASLWSGWQLVGPDQRRRLWMAPAPLGAVLDFGALRCWLATEAQQWGAQLQLGWRALSCSSLPDGRLVTRLRDRQGRLLHCRSRWVIDASGQGRALLGEPDGPEPLQSGVGVEWLLQVPQPLWQAWCGRLSFCLGSDWVPQGYGWLFPMQPGVLKLGICRLEDPRRPQPPLAPQLQRLIDRLLGPAPAGGWTVLDRHGGLIRSTVRRREAHRRGRLIGLGDAVSTANLLGGEGIRHALSSSRVLAPLLLAAVQQDSTEPLRPYPRLLRRALGPRWSLSGRLARRTWLGLQNARADRRLNRLLSGLEQETAETLSALLFDYRFERYGLRAMPYLLGWR